MTVAFVALVAFGAALGAIVLTGPVPTRVVNASVSDNVMGWAWASPIGWISLNDQNPGSGGGTYGVNTDLTTGQMNGFGWSENVGWVCFGSSCSVASCSGTPPTSNAPYDAMNAQLTPAPYSAGPSVRNFHGWAKVCNEADAGWISLNCNDVSPSACGSYAYRVPLDMSTKTFTDATAPGWPGNGTSFGWNGNGDGTGFGYVDFRQAYLVVPPENTAGRCANFPIDDDLNGAPDCADPQCSAFPNCAPPPPPLTEAVAPGGVDVVCSDGIDNDGNGSRDCEDLSCQGVASMCTIAWLKTNFGNVYAQQGIQSIAAPATQFNATYCLSNTDGLITGFASQQGCLETSAALTLPSGTTGYKGSLGNIDIVGIENGRYGPVQVIADGAALPAALGGKIYMFVGDGTNSVTLPVGLMFQNGIGSTGRGNGMLYVKNADLHIMADMSYAQPSVENYLRNLASFGVIVTQKAGSGGGNIYIDSTVQNLVGAFFAESSIHTGVANNQLNVYGLFASRALYFERTGGTATTAAETVSFDGRAVANPPPGMQDIGKSLPTSKDAF